MRPGTQFESSPEQHVYHVSLAKSLGAAVSPLIGFILCTSICSIFVGSLLLPSYEVNKLLGALVFLILFAPLSYLFAMAILWQTRGRLITSPEGITYATLGYCIFTPWVHVAGKGSRNERLMQKSPRSRLITGLELRQPAPLLKIRPWLPSFFPPLQQASLFIPLGNVVSDWEYSELGEDIRRYAPQIWQEGSEQ
jgi:hypothetical protein